MKIILVHNFYGSSAPSGENTVYLAERDMLQRSGHEIIEFTRHSDEIRSRGAIGTLKGALSAPWSFSSVSKLRTLLKDERPDILHAHNTFPLISPAIFRAARSFSVATVLTLHNYRLFCAAGIPEREGVSCTECLDGNSALPALRHRCYRDSTLATVPMALLIELHRRLGTWENCVDAFIALTTFQKEVVTDAGLPIKAVHVKPHFYDNPPLPLPWNERQRKVVYVGRLASYKGVHLLVEAWKKWGVDAPALEIIGEGPDREHLERLAVEGDTGVSISFTGNLPFGAVQDRIASSKLLVLPSLSFEGFPMVIREAFALGVPVAGSRLGSIPCIVEEGKNGILFNPGDPADLLTRVRSLWQQNSLLEVLGTNARNEFNMNYTAESNYKHLLQIYQAAMIRRRRLRLER